MATTFKVTLLNSLPTVSYTFSTRGTDQVCNTNIFHTVMPELACFADNATHAHAHRPSTCIDINAMMAELTEEQKSDPVIAHALNVRSALATSNYHRFFKLYNEAPNMDRDSLFETRTHRSQFYSTRSSYSYRPSIPLEFIRDELSFAEMEECIKFLREHNGACFDSTQTALDTKTAYPGLFEAGRKYDKIDIKGQI
ncbi:hypothetical protein BC937DRAFT_88304 [Endogone sp. FLAS-F59071]|nr:hypothetical protein BC937DRAFT_88304 [Endogone sp. FLAS-F59071]|eukprot:RUS18818.1 hypothetical protein BC937DRAFT_88304 [Endogone sp. FLAS-F59071]